MPSSALNRKTGDKRRHPRVKLTTDILRNPTLKAFDISEGGMGVESNENLRVGSVVQLQLKVGQDTLTLDAKVMHCRKSQSVFNECYVAGLMFVGFSPTQLLDVRSLMDRLA